MEWLLALIILKMKLEALTREIELGSVPFTGHTWSLVEGERKNPDFLS